MDVWACPVGDLGSFTLTAALDAFRGRRVLLTGHTGFKGGWLALWLSELGAEVTGYALPPATGPSMFAAARLRERVRHIEGDVRDLDAFRRAWRACRPEFVFHLAAQAIVRESYRAPLDTVTTNVVGTSHLLELARGDDRRIAVVSVTSDKCYENVEWVHGYREDDRLGGRDVYSGSKAAAELLIASYRRSFFEAVDGPAVASVRAGNVIGGGDWSPDRIVPDCIRALTARRTIRVRHPQAVRPWQHVLEPLSGYLMVAAALQRRDEAGLAARTAWNFGPTIPNSRPVADLVAAVVREWGSGAWEAVVEEGGHEATLLRLAIDKAQLRLGWRPRWDFDEAIHQTIAWYRAHAEGEDLASLSLSQIARYLSRPGVPDVVTA